MEVNVGKHEFTIIWDGVYYFALSNYPNITKWELAKLLAFVEYENMHGRQTKMVCQNKDILAAVNYAIAHPKSVAHAIAPEKITECAACYFNGCLTAFVCHNAPVEAAKKILSSGKLLSAVKAFDKPAECFVNDPRNAAGDPADFFEYVMLSWGNCQAGDRLIMERKLGQAPTEQQLATSLTPGVRFYYRYSDIIRHPGYVFDGYHPAKVRNQLDISTCHSIIIPQEYEENLRNFIPENLADRVHYLPHDRLSLWDWSKLVYDFVLTIEAK